MALLRKPLMPEHRIHFFVWHPTDHAFLTVDGALPTAPSASDRAEPDLDFATRPLLKPDVPGGLERDPQEHLIVHEALALPDALPTGARWTDRGDALTGFPGVVQRTRELLADPVPELRPPWARRGWLTDVEAWIDRHVARTGPIATVKSWCLSCVLKVPTASGPVYFKVSNDRPLFANEATVTRALARRFPGHIPDPIAIDAAHGWLLLPDLGPAIGQSAPMEPLLEDFARLQRTAAASIDDLLADGCLDRRPPVLDAHVQALLAAEDGVEGLTDAEVDALRDALPELRARIARSPLPATLVHGDLHGGNVAAGAHGGYVYFDLTDVCIGPPTVDLLDQLFEEDAARRDAHREAYFRAWGIADHTELWRDARTILCLHHAVSYWYIERAQEPYSRQEMAGTRAHLLRRALESL